MPYNETELAAILTEVRRPFQGPKARDEIMDRWRAIRRGGLDPWLPDEITNFLGAVKERFYYHDRLPEFTVNRFKQRLGANDVVMSIRPRGDVGPQAQRLYEDLEDGVNGIHEMLDPVGLIDLRGREHQAADGVIAMEPTTVRSSSLVLNTACLSASRRRTHAPCIGSRREAN